MSSLLPCKIYQNDRACFLLSFIITVLREKSYLYKINFILARGFICIIYFLQCDEYYKIVEVPIKLLLGLLCEIFLYFSIVDLLLLCQNNYHHRVMEMGMKDCRYSNCYPA